MTKQELRKAVKERQKQTDESYYLSAGKAISEKVMSSDEFRQAESVFVYVSTEYEPDTRGIIRKALESGKTVCVPKTYSDGVMKPVIISGLNELVPGYMNIPEPCTDAGFSGIPDVAVIPCLAVSSDGNRLGHGGGYYDRYLDGKNIYKICLCFGRFVFDRIPAEKHDIKPDKIITELTK